MRARTVLEEEERGWEQLTLAFGQIPPDRFEEPTLTAEGWSPKDVMYHVAAWAEEATTLLERIRAGTHRGGLVDVERLNREWHQIGSKMDPDVVRLRFAKARNLMRDAFLQLDEVDPVAFEWFDESGPRHYEEHLADLVRFVGAHGPPA